MRYIILVILLCLSVGVAYSSEDADIVFSYKHSMRIVNNHVVISYRKNQSLLQVVEKTLNGKETKRNVKISSEQKKSINDLFNKINWSTVDPRAVFGLDGHSWGIVAKKNK